VIGIIGTLIKHKPPNENETGKPNGQPNTIENGEAFVTFEITQRYCNKIPNHVPLHYCFHSTVAMSRPIGTTSPYHIALNKLRQKPHLPFKCTYS
jgi:hypothetical protein